MTHLLIEFVYDELRSDSIRVVFEECFEFGCATAKDGGMETCNYASEETDFVPVDDHPTERAIRSISTTGQGSMRLWIDEVAFRLQVGLETDLVPGRPTIGISVDEVYVEQNDLFSAAEATSHIDRLLGLSERLFNSSQPLLAFGTMVNDESGSADVPGDELQEGQVETLAWLTVLPTDVVEQIGREKVQSAPAARVLEFNGAVALVLSDFPAQYLRIKENEQKVVSYLVGE